MVRPLSPKRATDCQSQRYVLHCRMLTESLSPMEFNHAPKESPRLCHPLKTKSAVGTPGNERVIMLKEGHCDHGHGVGRRPMHLLVFLAIVRAQLNGSFSTMTRVPSATAFGAHSQEYLRDSVRSNRPTGSSPRPSRILANRPE